MVRFIHLSDSHIGPTEDFMSYQHNPLANLKQLVEIINGLPYEFDFVLHSGDVVEDASPAAYRIAKSALAELKAPIRYLAGNHDDARELQRVLLGVSAPQEHYDYTFEAGGVQFVALDTRGPVQPGGELAPSQLAWLREQCAADGPPLVICMHHEPIPLDVPWLDTVSIMPAAMILGNGAEFVDAIQPAKKRLRGVFFGHVHRSFQVQQDGILYCSAPSTFGQLKTWPGLSNHVIAPEEAPGYCLVTVDENRTIVQQNTFARPY